MVKKKSLYNTSGRSQAVISQSLLDCLPLDYLLQVYGEINDNKQEIVLDLLPDSRNETGQDWNLYDIPNELHPVLLGLIALFINAKGSPFKPIFEALEIDTTRAYYLRILKETIQCLDNYSDQGLPLFNNPKKKRKLNSVLNPFGEISEEHNELCQNLIETEREHKAMKQGLRKQMRAITSQILKFNERKNTLKTAKASDNEKKMKVTAKAISQGVQGFWKTVGLIGLRRLKFQLNRHNLVVRARKQREWVERVERYTKKLSLRLIHDRSGESSSESISDTGWDDQEREDAAMEDQMSSSSDSVCDEVESLRRENELPLEDLLQAVGGEAFLKFIQTEEPSQQCLSNLDAGSESSVSSSGWSRQEEQDKNLDEIMESCSGSDASSVVGVSEADQLRDASELPLEELLKGYQPLRTNPVSGTTQWFNTQNRDVADVSDSKNNFKQELPAFNSTINFNEVPASPTDTNEVDVSKYAARRHKRRHKDTKPEVEVKKPKKEIRNDKSEYPSMQEQEETKHLKNKIKDETEIRNRYVLSSLLKAQLRPYQIEGFEWLVRLHDAELNGILADEMGLGKTVQCISLLTYLASERGIWGPHLVIAPSSVVVNWEQEFLKFAPGIKVLTYLGSKKEREKKRQGWMKPWTFNVLLTSYSLAVSDAAPLRRFSWYYLVLDEAQNLKNSNTTRWQTLLQYNSQRSLLLTGTPLQNSLLELWSLMFFIVPEIFGTHTEWKDLFSEPLTSAIEKSQIRNEARIMKDLYKILRPFLCRRLKKDVESQMPSKVEKVIRCRLSKRQRHLYDELLVKSVRESMLDKGGYLAAMNVLMHLRKICNHPYLVEDVQVESQVADQDLRINWNVPKMFLQETREYPVLTHETGRHLLFNLFQETIFRTRAEITRAQELCPDNMIMNNLLPYSTANPIHSVDSDTCLRTYHRALGRSRHKSLGERFLSARITTDNALEELRDLESQFIQGERQSRLKFFLNDPVRKVWHSEYPSNFIGRDTLEFIVGELNNVERNAPVDISVARSGFNVGNSNRYFPRPNLTLSKTITSSSPEGSLTVLDKCLPNEWIYVQPNHRRLLFERLKLIRSNPVAELGPLISVTGSGGESLLKEIESSQECSRNLLWDSMSGAEYEWILSSQVIVPDAREIEYDSGKLLQLTSLLFELQRDGHKCIIFTQMSKMLDILEKYLNTHKFSYIRFDGSIKPELRQDLIDRFNEDPRIFLFVASTRVGGIGINLTGASVVIFYDTDWNPAMDRQAMDRCHRLGQTRDVVIYRFITEATIEENIWRKQLQKRLLDDVVVNMGQFNAQVEDPFAGVDLGDLLYTMDSADDLYMTRVLHDTVAPSDLMMANLETVDENAVEIDDINPSAMSKSILEALPLVEDCEDTLQLKNAKNELRQEIKSDGNWDDSIIDTSKHVVVKQANQEFLDAELITASNELTHMKLFIDSEVGEIEVIPLFIYGVNWLEKVVPSKSMLNELRAASISADLPVDGSSFNGLNYV